MDVDRWELDAVIGDRFLVCSDGLFNEIAQGRMAATLRTYAEPAEAAKVLVGLANAAGGRDNITCVVVDVVDDADTAERRRGHRPTRRAPPTPPERRPGSVRPPPGEPGDAPAEPGGPSGAMLRCGRRPAPAGGRCHRRSSGAAPRS